MDSRSGNAIDEKKHKSIKMYIDTSRYALLPFDKKLLRISYGTTSWSFIKKGR